MFPSDQDKFYGIFVKNFVNGFKNTNVEITSKSLIYGRGKSSFEKIKKYTRFYFSVVKNIIKNDYDLIYVHFPNYASLPLLVCLPLLKKPLVLNFHGTDALAKSKLAKNLQFAVKPVIQKAHTVVVPSEYFKHVVSEKFNIGLDRIFVSPSGGIDTGLFRNNNLPKNDNRFVLGYVGRIDEGKGWDVLLKAIAQVKSKIPNLKCLVAGNGAQLAVFKEQITALQISDTVIFEGSVAHNKLVEFYNKLDIFIFPTRLTESLGLVGIEALLCGVPVVGSKIGGLQDYIIEGENGAFFEPGNYHDLADKILDLFTHIDKLQALRNAAPKSVEKYQNKTVANQLSQKLEDIVLRNE